MDDADLERAIDVHPGAVAHRRARRRQDLHLRHRGGRSASAPASAAPIVLESHAPGPRWRASGRAAHAAILAAVLAAAPSRPPRPPASRSSWRAPRSPDRAVHAAAVPCGDRAACASRSAPGRIGHRLSGTSRSCAPTARRLRRPGGTRRGHRVDGPLEPSAPPPCGRYRVLLRVTPRRRPRDAARTVARRRGCVTPGRLPQQRAERLGVRDGRPAGEAPADVGGGRAVDQRPVGQQRRGLGGRRVVRVAGGDGVVGAGRRAGGARSARRCAGRRARPRSRSRAARPGGGRARSGRCRTPAGSGPSRRAPAAAPPSARSSSAASPVRSASRSSTWAAWELPAGVGWSSRSRVRATSASPSEPE